MNKRSGILLTLAHGGMEICWIYACTSFFINAILGRTVSLFSAVAIFAFAALLSHFSRNRGWRIVAIAGVHLLGYSCASLFVLHGFFYAVYPHFGKAWIAQLLGASRTPMEWVHLVSLLIWTSLLWLGGVALAKREGTYVGICTRLDIGLAAFFVLFLIKLVIRVKGGMNIDDQVSSMMVYPYLLVGLTAVGMARVGRGGGSKSFLPGHRAPGILMGAVSLALLSASCLALFLIPALTQVADAGRQVLKGAALRILPVVAGVMRFMYFGGRIRPEPPSGSSPKGGEAPGFLSTGTWWTDLLEKIFRWGIEVLVILFLAVITAVLIFLFLRWLFSRTAISPKAKADHGVQLSWLVRLRTFFIALWRAVKNVTQGYSKAAELYSVLGEWGRRSGLPRRMSDTPLEFGALLADRFPKLKVEIGSIIAAFNFEAYGETGLTGEQLAGALQAWRTVRSPVHWPRRLRIRFIERTSGQ